MPITSFVFDENSKTASWQDGATPVVILQLRQACNDAQRNVVFALPLEDGRKVLDVFGHDGKLITQLPAPEGCYFEYLLDHASYGVRAVCSGVELAGGSMDCYFKIDLAAGKLVQQGRAY